METSPVSSSITLNTNANNSISTNETSNNISTSNTVETNSQVEDNNSLNLESGAAILIEQSTGQVLYSHNAHEQLRPASVTKTQ